MRPDGPIPPYFDDVLHYRDNQDEQIQLERCEPQTIPVTGLALECSIGRRQTLMFPKVRPKNRRKYHATIRSERHM
jgi:hypothetical protein